MITMNSSDTTTGATTGRHMDLVHGSPKFVFFELFWDSVRSVHFRKSNVSNVWAAIYKSRKSHHILQLVGTPSARALHKVQNDELFFSRSAQIRK